jgi:hypothetical protein
MFAILVVLPVACQRSASTPTSAPSLAVEATEETTFPSGSRATVWRLRGQGVRKLTVRLVVYADGRERGRTQFDCDWPGASAALDARVTLLMENGRAFGVVGKRLPSLGLEFGAGGPTTRARTQSKSELLDDAGEGASGVFLPGPLSSREVLFHEVRGDVAGRPFGRINSDEELAAESAGGRVALAVFLEWSE